MRTNFSIFKEGLVIFVALLLSMMVTSCIKESLVMEPADNGREVTIVVNIPGAQTPSTRALSEAQEKQINSVDVLVFRNSDNKLVQWKSVSASAIAPSSDAWMFRIKDLAETDNITVAVVANAPAEVTSMLSAVGGTMANPLKNSVLEKLTYAFTGAKWITSGAGTMYLPMYGELPVSGSIYASLVQDIELKWMVAKIDVVNAVAPDGTPVPGNFNLMAVHLVNHNQNGYLTPKWNASGAPFAEDPQLPWLPAAPNAKVWTTSGDEQTYTVAAPSGGAQELSNEIYTFESWAAYSPSEDPKLPNPTPPATATRLILEGEYTDANGTHTYYYPVDFTYPQDAGTQSTKYMPLLRNHRYLVNIVKAEGRGYDHISEAVAASGVISNLKTRIIVVDESSIRHIVFNGQYYLGVNEKAFTVAAAGEQNIELQISTNYTDGWKAEVENPAANSWLTLGAASGQITDKTLMFNVTPIDGGDWAFRSGTILLTAGRLDMRIPVTQGNYKLETDTKPTYMLNSQVEVIHVRANFPWMITAVSDDDNILKDENDLIDQYGGPNIGMPGDDISFTMEAETEDGSKTGKTATITFLNTLDGSEWYVTITAIEALYVGMFGGELKEIADGVWQFERQLYVQRNDASIAKSWGPNTQTNVISYWDGKGNTFALRTTTYPAANLCFIKNRDSGNISGESDPKYNWYLPALKQLMAVWVANAGFDSNYKLSNYYWSATESSQVNSRDVNFDNGFITYGISKDNSYRVRCVREL